MMEERKPLLEVRHLKKYFGLGGKKELKAVDDVSFVIYKGETFGIVGESGCGKTTCGRTCIGVYDATGGEVLYDGKDIRKQTKQERKEFTRKVQMIFQDPYSSLDPRLKVHDIIAEGMQIHHLVSSKKEEETMVQRLLRQVGLNPEHAGRYVHEFSGGQRQRIGIARALAVDPEFLLCDEPISALDVSVQAQIINLLVRLQKERGLTSVFIAHDLSMVRHISNRIGVMYLGKLVEVGDSEEIYQNHLHPYTEALLSSVPLPDPELAHRSEPIMLQGDIPSPIDPPSGCRFRTRCPYATQLCAEQEPPLTEVGSNHAVACHRVTPARGNEEKGGIL